MNLPSPATKLTAVPGRWTALGVADVVPERIGDDEVKKLMKTYIKYPPRKLQSETYDEPITLQQYQRYKWIRDSLKKDGFSLTLPSGN